MDDSQITNLHDAVMGYYLAHGRHDLPWRQPDSDGKFNPYKIMVSELMLQQTQVGRVIPKYLAFIARFPTVEALAQASLGEVLTLWSGLGYNRRAKFLYQAAQMVVQEMDGVFPSTQAELTKLPGVGHNTAGAITAYVFNKPVVFIETNIRTVFIHHFFADDTSVSDKAIEELIRPSLAAQPRDWYWALMDYGSFLKQSIGNKSRLSATYKKQSKFAGSKRQIRGQVIKQLTLAPARLDQLRALIDDDRLPAVITELLQEKLISFDGRIYSL
ncbi:MAG: mutY [Candidatus Saccharibacteria bacterium]|nr:mutY [Candidatus Saccharibacteria bacterium]